MAIVINTLLKLESGKIHKNTGFTHFMEDDIALAKITTLLLTKVESQLL